jgi:hypothetical protein
VIKIGDFARLGHVSVVTLRHYDEIGLLKPVTVDSFTTAYPSGREAQQLERWEERPLL